MECPNDNCSHEFDIDLSELERESNGNSGSHTTSYSYTGGVVCPEYGHESEVSIDTDEVDDTGEVLSSDFT
ncbi:hypothetical protein [Vibrio sp. FF145]|uniref:hypothetical protein n=1 Tax=Vibrio sp. FF145 TaxID=3230013 RepID=UPI00352C5795